MSRNTHVLRPPSSDRNTGLCTIAAREPMAGYGFGKELEMDWQSAIEQVTAALEDQGFGVLTRIDVHDVLRAKIGADIEPYVILGACNPNLASQAIGCEPEIGLLLPCNVLVKGRGDGGSAVSMIDPDSMGQMADNAALRPLMRDARARLQAALDALG